MPKRGKARRNGRRRRSHAPVAPPTRTRGPAPFHVVPVIMNRSHVHACVQTLLLHLCTCRYACKYTCRYTCKYTCKYTCTPFTHLFPFLNLKHLLIRGFSTSFLPQLKSDAGKKRPFFLLFPTVVKFPAPLRRRVVENQIFFSFFFLQSWSFKRPFIIASCKMSFSFVFFVFFFTPCTICRRSAGRRRRRSPSGFLFSQDAPWHDVRKRGNSDNWNVASVWDGERQTSSSNDRQAVDEKQQNASWIVLLHCKKSESDQVSKCHF